MEVDLSKYIQKKKVVQLMDLNNNIDDLCNSPLLKTQSIKEFFDDSNIFVTGKWLAKHDY